MPLGVSVDEQIEFLKRDGHIFTSESLDQLMQIVNTENILNLDLSQEPS